MPACVSSPRLTAVRWLAGLAAAAALLAVQGCATHSEGFKAVEQQAAARNIPEALKALESFHQGSITSVDKPLKHLNRGTLLRLQGNYAESNQELETAKQMIDELAAVSVREQAGAVLVNDSVRSYTGDGVEQLFLFAVKALNYLQMGDTDAAAVEARQFEIKHRLIQERNPEAKFLSGAFVRYLNAMIYEAVGEPDSARIEYAKAVEGYEQQAPFSGMGTPSIVKSQLADTRAKKGSGDAGEVIFILHNGLGPTLAENIIQVVNPMPQNGATMLRIALPKFEPRIAPVARVKVSIAGKEASTELVEDINALAKKSFEDRLPGIQARAIARLVAKNAAAAETKKQAQNQAGQAAALMSLFSAATDILTAVSERADTRTWSLMPGNVQMARLQLPPGKHDITTTYYGHGGQVLTTRQYVGIQVNARRKTYVSDYYL